MGSCCEPHLIGRVGRGNVPPHARSCLLRSVMNGTCRARTHDAAQVLSRSLLTARRSYGGPTRWPEVIGGAPLGAGRRDRVPGAGCDRRGVHVEAGPLGLTVGVGVTSSLQGVSAGGHLSATPY